MKSNNTERKIWGLKYVFTGDGKGKTSAALGVVLRSLLLGKKVIWISWYKSKDWKISEMKLTKKFSGLLQMYWMGKGFYIKETKPLIKKGNEKLKLAKVNDGVVVDYDTPAGHKLAAQEALKLALRMIEEEKCWLLVLDEINQTVDDGLLKIEELQSLLIIKSQVNLILTGRSFPRSLDDKVDLVSEIKKVKHPFDVGTMAKEGLDF